MSTAPSNIGRIGRFRLIKRLAVGGMADIYLAQAYGPQGYERTAVVKTIRADLVEEEELIQMLLEEARIASCLKHENIVELLEVGEEGGTQFLAMEFVFGRDLGQIRDRCEERGLKIPARHIATIMIDVLDALHYAHFDATYEGKPLRVVHRDVSPQNILVGFDGSVKLLDFGLAKAAAQISRTRAGVLKGKYAYMAPEQISFKRVDQRADIFSTGVLLWELSTQRRLFYRSSDYETVKAVVDSRAPFPKLIRSEIPWSLSWSAWRATRKTPMWRYRDAQTMRASLLNADERDRTTARNELSDWVSQLFGEQLAARDLALRRVRSDPLRHRQLLDAGFEMLEETTDPELRLYPLPAGLERDKKTPEESGLGAGLRGAALGVLGTWRWFTLIFSALVFLSVAAGIYIGSSQGSASDRYGHLHVLADVENVEVIVGETKLGAAPIQNIPVIPGRHRIIGISRKEGRKETVEVFVEAGENKVIRLKFQAQ